MNKPVKIAAIVAGVSIIGFVLYKYVKGQIDLLQNYTAKVIGIQLQKISLSEISFTLKIRFSNLSSIEATISKLYLDVYLENKKVGFIVESRQFIIPAAGSTDIDLYFSFKPQDIVANALNLFLGLSKNKDLLLSLRGTANVKSGFISRTIPISYDTTVKQYL